MYSTLLFSYLNGESEKQTHLCRTIGLSEYWTVGLLDCRTIGLSEYWTVGLTGINIMKPPIL